MLSPDLLQRIEHAWNTNKTLRRCVAGDPLLINSTTFALPIASEVAALALLLREFKELLSSKQLHELAIRACLTTRADALVSYPHCRWERLVESGFCTVELLLEVVDTPGAMEVLARRPRMTQLLELILRHLIRVVFVQHLALGPLAGPTPAVWEKTRRGMFAVIPFEDGLQHVLAGCAPFDVEYEVCSNEAQRLRRDLGWKAEVVFPDTDELMREYAGPEDLHAKVLDYCMRESGRVLNLLEAQTSIPYAREHRTILGNLLGRIRDRSRRDFYRGVHPAQMLCAFMWNLRETFFDPYYEQPNGSEKLRVAFELLLRRIYHLSMLPEYFPLVNN